MPGANGHGGARRLAGRPTNSVRNAADRKALALAASQYTMEALEMMVKLMRKSKMDTVKLAAANCILDRAVGRVPRIARRWPWRRRNTLWKRWR
jgi:hypothetical protein